MVMRDWDNDGDQDSADLFHATELFAGDYYSDHLEEDQRDESPTVRCPHCRREIYEFADRCPHCGKYVSEAELHPSSYASQWPIWWVVVVVMVLLALLSAWLRN
jgi:predicted amidophosphoribosyltransferase